MSVDIVSDIEPRVQYTATAAQTAFDYPFPIFADGDLVVDIDGVTQTLTTDYTVTGEGADAGGTVTLVVAATGGEIVTIYRDIPIERITDFQQNGRFSSSAFNDELDKITMIQQQLETRLGLTLRFPMTASTALADLELSPVASWLGKAIKIDENGVPVPLTLTEGTVADLATRQVFTATAGQTTFTVAGGYTVGAVDVFQNGAKLVATEDFTAVNGSTVVLTQAATVSDRIDITAWSINPSYLPQYYGITTAEGAAGVTPTDYSYPEFDVRRYGATGNGTTDDAAAINTTADVVRQAQHDRKLDTVTTPTPVLAFGGGRVYRVNSNIWAGTEDATTGLVAAQFIREIDLCGSTVVGYTSGTPILDWTGGNGIDRRVIRGGKLVGAATSTPSIGVLLARNSVGTSVDGASIMCDVVGHFTIAAVYDYAAELTHIGPVRIWNYYATGAPALVIDNDNVRYSGASPNSSFPATALQSCIDFKFDKTDFRNQASALGAGFLASCIELLGAGEAYFDDCFINSTLVNNEHLVFIGTNNSVNPERITFNQCSFHSNNGTGASISVQGVVKDLTLTNNRNVHNTLLYTPSASQIDGLVMMGNTTKDDVDFSFTGAKITAAHCLIETGFDVDNQFTGFLQTKAAATVSLPTDKAGVWLKHDGTVDFMGGALINVGAVGATSTVGEYLSGTVTFATAATATVSLATTETDANYRVLVTGRANENFWTSSVGVSQFTINSSNASSVAVVDWTIVR